MVFEWDGWTRRTLTLEWVITKPTRPGAAMTPEAALAKLHAAHRGGEEPNQHRITGRLARSLGFDHPWVIGYIDPDESNANTAIGVTIFLVELDPDAVTEGASPIDPGSGDPSDPPEPDPDAGVSDATRDAITDAEALESDYGYE